MAAQPHQFAAEEQQELDERAVENQAEDEVESHVDEANKVQMVKKCQVRRCSKLFIRFRLQKSRESMTNGVEMRTTKQDGDEDSFESTEVSAWKATESRNEI